MFLHKLVPRMREILQPFDIDQRNENSVRGIPFRVASIDAMGKDLSLRCQLILKIAMNFVPLLQMEFLVDTF